MSAFVASMPSLVLGVVRHRVGELVLAVVLFTLFINILERRPFIINIVASVSSSKHLIQQN